MSCSLDLEIYVRCKISINVATAAKNFCRFILKFNFSSVNYLCMYVVYIASYLQTLISYLINLQLFQALTIQLKTKLEIRQRALHSYVKLWVNQFQTSVGTLMV